MVILGIDTGKTTGLAVLQTRPEPRVLWCGETTDITGDAALIGQPYVSVWDGQVSVGARDIDRAVYERVQSYGAGLASSLVDTAEIGGWCRLQLGAVPMTRPEVIRTLGLTGRGISKSAVWGEVVRVLGSDKGGKLCPKRNNKAHPPRKNAQGFSAMLRTHYGQQEPLCSVCNDTGYDRAPGPLAQFKGLPHAKDALAIALAYALREGLL